MPGTQKRVVGFPCIERGIFFAAAKHPGLCAIYVYAPVYSTGSDVKCFWPPLIRSGPPAIFSGRTHMQRVSCWKERTSLPPRLLITREWSTQLFPEFLVKIGPVTDDIICDLYVGRLNGPLSGGTGGSQLAPLNPEA